MRCAWYATSCSSNSHRRISILFPLGFFSPFRNTPPHLRLTPRKANAKSIGETMEPVSAILAITGATVRTGSKLWEISGEWRDAPSDVRFLRDDLASTERFFRLIQQVVLPNKCSAGISSPLVPLADLEQLVDQGIALLGKLEAVVDRVTTAGARIDGGGHPSAGREGAAVKVGKAKRCLWIRYSRRVAKLRADLAVVRSSICGWLIIYNM